MDNNLSLRFERNNYFYGKLLSVDDFVLEQDYFNYKRRLLNRMLYSGGILAGLKVTNSKTETDTVLVAPGIAIDYQGREITVNRSKDFKLTDKDVSSCEHNYVYLCLKYDQYFDQKVPVIGDIPRSEDYSRIIEGFQLSWAYKLQQSDLLNVIFNKQVVDATEDFIVTQTVPKYAIRDKSITITVHVTKLSGKIIKPVNYTLHGEALVKDFEVLLNDLEYPHDENNFMFEVPIKEDNYSIISMSTDKGIKWDTKWLKEGSEEDYIKIFNDSYDVNKILKDNPMLYLARVHFTRKGTQFIIGTIENVPFDQYIKRNDLGDLIQNLGVKQNKNCESNSDVVTIRFSRSYPENHTMLMNQLKSLKYERANLRTYRYYLSHHLRLNGLKDIGSEGDDSGYAEDDQKIEGEYLQKVDGMTTNIDALNNLAIQFEQEGDIPEDSEHMKSLQNIKFINLDYESDEIDHHFGTDPVKISLQLMDHDNNGQTIFGSADIFSNNVESSTALAAVLLGNGHFKIRIRCKYQKLRDMKVLWRAEKI